MATPQTPLRFQTSHFAKTIKQFPDDPVVLTEGDSWFSFPSHANTIDHIDELLKTRLSLLRLETSGDTLLSMTKGKQRDKVRELFDRYPIDAFLFSGGGNDVVGKELRELFDKVPDGGDWREHIRVEAMDRQYRQIADAYHSLAHLRDAYRPDCWIVTHGYGYANPSGKATKFWLWPIPLNIKRGPWIKQNLEDRGIHKAADQKAVVKYLIDRFNDVVTSVAASHGRFSVVDNRPSLGARDWSDELHPTRAGFRKVASAFVATLREKLPERFRA
jgi:hypothetical protein